MTVALIVVGAVWGFWLGRREGAHLGIGVGAFGVLAGVILGAGIGFGLGLVVWWIAVLVAVVLMGATAVIVRRW